MAVRKQVVSFGWNKQARHHLKVAVLMHRGREGKRKGLREKEKQRKWGSTEPSVYAKNYTRLLHR